MKRKTFKEFNKQAHEILGDEYIFYPPYVNMKTPIRYKHLVCNTSDTLIPSNIISNHASCKYCNEIKKAKEHSISEAEFKKRLYKVRPNDDIILLEPLQGLFKKTKAKCLVCGYGSDGKWKPLPVNLLAGKGCPSCAGNAPKTSSRVINEVKELGKGEYELLGTKRTKKDGLWLHLYHKKCNNDYWVRDYSFVEGYRCRFCQSKANGDRCRMSLDELKYKITQVADHKYEYVRGNYKNNQSLIRVRHKVCNTEFSTTWGMLQANKGLCPQCGATNGEQAVMKYLIDHKISYSYGYLIPDLKDINSLHFDFWLPQYSIAIEYDGQQHYYPVNFGGMSDKKAKEHFAYTKKHDQMKDDYCKQKQINLIRIPYNKSVTTILNKELLPNDSSKRVVKFKSVSSKDVLPLMLNYHYLHRRVSTSYTYGLYYKSELAGMITYTKPRLSLAQSISDKANRENTLELSRLYIKDKVSQNIPNITSEFVGWSLRQLKKHGNWYIISFADSGMHHTGAIYQATNFLYCGTTKSREYAWNGFGKHGGSWEKGKYYRYKIVSTPKYRYIKFVGSKSFKKRARRELKFDIESYPKKDTIHYQVGDSENRLIRDRKTDTLYLEKDLIKKLQKEHQ